MPPLLTPDQAIAKFGDAQGNILKSHGREFVACLFLEFTDAAKFRAWIAQLLDGTGPARVVSTKQQFEDWKQRQQNSAFDGKLFASLFFTADGLQQLGVAALPQEANNQGQRSTAFATGMRKSTIQGALSDPLLADLEPGWRNGAAPSAIHAMLLLADAHVANVNQAVASVLAQLPAFSGVQHVEERGQRLFLNPASKQDKEHFGYADGVSQPIYLDVDDGPTIHGRDKALGAEDLVLLPDSLSAQPNAWGSFFVFRKLSQQVNGFNAAETALAGQLQTTKDQAGALLVGRFRDGTPRVLQATAGASPTNNFDYAADPNGAQCPFHAHVRKMNPRGETSPPPATTDAELRHRITRRGVPYGTEADALNDQPAGLLFMCYQRNIAHQFEFLQQSWANNAGFLFGHGTVGLDPIIGQGNSRPPLTFPSQAPGGATSASFQQFVRLKGGEYFYAPSMSGLAALAGNVVR